MFRSVLQKMNIEVPEPEPAEGASPTGEGSADTAAIEERVVEALRTVYDPEIPVNIHELGLVYEVKVEPSGFVTVRMTLTSPSCPVAGTLPGEVELKVKGVEGVTDAKVELVWEPQWTMAMMSEAAKLQLNLL